MASTILSNQTEPCVTRLLHAQLCFFFKYFIVYIPLLSPSMSVSVYRHMVGAFHVSSVSSLWLQGYVYYVLVQNRR